MNIEYYSLSLDNIPYGGPSRTDEANKNFKSFSSACNFASNLDLNKKALEEECRYRIVNKNNLNIDFNAKIKPLFKFDHFEIKKDENFIIYDIYFQYKTTTDWILINYPVCNHKVTIKKNILKLEDS